MSLEFDSKWCEPISFDDTGIMVGRDGAFGVGTLLLLRCTASNRVLMGRKSYRVGFEGSNQFTLPGGMIRAASPHFNSCLEKTLERRVREETGISLASVEKLYPLDEHPPIIARYTVRGRKVSAAILPFYGEVETELPTSSVDSTVYAADWYNPLECIDQITKTNALILIQSLWDSFPGSIKAALKRKLSSYYEDARSDAAIVGAVPPRIVWEG